MKKFISKHKTLLIFSIFFLLVLFQHHFMWLYHDDYGYASLSYVGDIYKAHYAGYHTSLSDIFKFLGYHYNYWGGRVLYFFFECLILSFGIHLFRIIQSLIITLIFYYIYKIISFIIKREDYRIAIFIALLYGNFEIMMVRGGLFWITASVLYVYPILPFLMFIYYYVLKNDNKKMSYNVLMGILIFLATFSQEQISVMVVGFLGLYIGYKYLTSKKIDKRDIIMLIIALIGFGILMLAPGSKVRMQHPSSAAFYQLSFFEKIKLNVPQILLNNFGGYTRIFTIIFFISVCYIAYKNLAINKKWLKYLNAASMISNSIILTFTLYKHDGYFSFFYNYFDSSKIKFIVMLFFIIQLMFIIYSIVLYFMNKKQYIVSMLFLSSLLSQAAMLVAPYFPLRSAMIMEFILFIIIGLCFVEAISKLDDRMWYLIIPFGCVLLFNFGEITVGYMKNNNVNQWNHNKLIYASKQIKNGKKIKKIKLKKLPDIAYSCDQPYTEGFEYITTYMKVYYQIPMEVDIVYE